MKKNKQSNNPQKGKRSISSYIIKQEEPLLASLISNLPHKSRKILKAVLRDRQVSVEGETITQFDHALLPGQKVEVSWEQVLQQKHPKDLNLIFIDDDLIVINKPPGLLTIATDKEKSRTAYSMLSRYVKSENPDNKIFIIHRLDRETSGLLMFARSEKIKRAIQESWETTISQRHYVGVVEGQVTPPAGTITSWLAESKALTVYSSQNPEHGRKAITHYNTLKANNDFSLLRLKLETGRKHQIRVHMQDLKHSIVGDKKYGSGLNPAGRMCLHAQVLSFTHPTTGEACTFDTGIPGSFLKFFRANKKSKQRQ